MGIILNTVLQDGRGKLGKDYMGSLSYFLQQYLNLHVSKNKRKYNVKKSIKGLAGGRVIKNLRSNAGDTGLILVGELGSHMLQGN